MGFQFIGETKVIQLTPGITEINVTDMYSRWKDWVQINDNAKFLPAFRVVGGEPTIGSNRISPYYFLMNGWRLRPQEANHTLTIDGILIVDGGGDPYLSTIGTYNVRIKAVMPLQAEFIVAQLPEIEFASFQNAVWIDSVNGQAGTEYPRGTRQYPVNNWSDAYTIMLTQRFSRYGLMTNSILGAVNVEGAEIFGMGHINTLLSIDASAETQRCTFKNLTIVGYLDGRATLEKCLVGNIDYINGFINECGLAGTIKLSGLNPALITNSAQIDVNKLPIIDMNGTGHNIVVSDYHGAIKITNLTGDAVAKIGLSSGRVIIDETVTSGTIIISGVGGVEDNSSGDAIIITKNLINGEMIADISNKVSPEAISTAILDAPLNNIKPNTFGYFITKKLLSVAKFIGLK